MNILGTISSALFFLAMALVCVMYALDMATSGMDGPKKGKIIQIGIPVNNLFLTNERGSAEISAMLMKFFDEKKYYIQNITGGFLFCLNQASGNKYWGKVEYAGNKGVSVRLYLTFHFIAFALQHLFLIISILGGFWSENVGMILMKAFLAYMLMLPWILIWHQKYQEVKELAMEIKRLMQINPSVA